MFKDNTVFVIGAGASAEFGFPVGGQLSDAIKENCQYEIDSSGRFTDGEQRIIQHYENTFGRADDEKVAEFNKRLEAMRKIRAGIDSAESIDEYIFRYSGDSIVAEVGKLQIAYVISGAESESFLNPKAGS